MTTDPAKPSDVPIQPAASVLVLADRPRLEVLLLHRRAGSEFVGGMVVFPGGAVDESDHSSASQRLVAGDVESVTRGTGGEAAHMVAAVRETLEETGLWLGSDPTRPVAARWEIDSGRRRLADVAVDGSVRADRIPHAGRWITPSGAPRRYDTHFFVTSVDARGTDVGSLEPDGSEVVDLEWAEPAEAVRRIGAGDLVALEPTVVYLEALTRYESAEQVIDAARRGQRSEHRDDWTTI